MNEKQYKLLQEIGKLIREYEDTEYKVIGASVDFGLEDDGKSATHWNGEAFENYDKHIYVHCSHDASPKLHHPEKSE
jgi:hypothetical protein